MIVVGAGRPGRTSLGIFLPWPPHRQVSTFTSEGVGGLCSSPLPVLLIPRAPRCLPVRAEMVDTWIWPTVATSRTGGSSLVPQ